jgi:REP element-mobilizing transposase RayT
MNDHAHLLVQLPQIIAPDEIVNHLADSTSELVDGMGRNEKLVWEEDFGVVSVSKSHLEIVTKYVETQVERHASGNINETLERISSAD